MIFRHGIFKNILLSGHSCARKMRHLLLAGYEDVPSFLNQWKLKVYTKIFSYTAAQLQQINLCLASHDIKLRIVAVTNVPCAMRF